MSRFGLILLIPLGAALAYVGWTAAGLAVAFIGFVVTISVHIAAGIKGYRRAMDHEWPHVEPRRWDDDW